nr:hypothetical protein CFP56_47354 [Quercus suber]
MAKHHLCLDFSNLDMEVVEKKILEDHQTAEGIGKGGKVASVDRATVDPSSSNAPRQWPKLCIRACSLPSNFQSVQSTTPLMDNSTIWDNSPPEDLSKSWEENCQDQLRNIHELNKFGLQLLTDWQRRRDVAILQLLVHVVHGIWMMGVYCSPRYVDRVLTESSAERENIRQELLSEL